MSGYALGIVFVGGGLLLLGAILRFSVLSPIRTRGSRRALRSPDLDAVQKVCGFPLPAELGRMYREAHFIDMSEFELVDGSKSPPASWTIGSFKALTAPVVKEWRAISGVPGVPLADDIDKGVYFVSTSGSVILASPNVSGGQESSHPALQRSRRLRPGRLLKVTPDKALELMRQGFAGNLGA